MADPVTIGTLVASALAIASEASLKGLIGEGVKDAYKALKDKVAAWGGGDLAALEDNPASPARRNVVAEIIDSQPDDAKLELPALAEKIIAALRASRNIGLEVGKLEALEVQLGAISVAKGIGAQIGHAQVLGTFKTGPITVGDTSGKL
jgi:hypothetical protein